MTITIHCECGYKEGHSIETEDRKERHEELQKSISKFEETHRCGDPVRINL